MEAELPQDWQQALKRGQGVVAEIRLGASSAQPQALAGAWLEQRKQGAFFFLEDQAAADVGKRFSLMAGEPLFSFLARGRRGVWHGGGSTQELNEAPEQAFESLGKAFRNCGALESLPGLCPLLGWLSYEAGARYERLPLPRQEPLGMPDWHMMLPREWAWLDLERKEWRFRLLLADRPFFHRIQDALGILGRKDCEALPTDLPRMVESWEQGVHRLVEGAKASVSPPENPARRPLKLSDSLDQVAFCAAVAKARDYIASGDVFQVNLSHRQSAPYAGHAWPLFRRLSQVNPSPQACFADLGSYQIISASPERLFLQDGDHVETHPIAGTLGSQQAAQELKQSAKDRAEHVMTVDIERNDLSRVCRPGSVRVKGLMELESYSHLHHLVSRVEGTLKEGLDLPDLFRAAFPGGSITGAPKIRCMEIIAELEGERRGLYTGALGYWDPIHRRADFNILIRTIFLSQGRAVWQVGAGIVADSDPELEWQETLHKAAALKLALESTPA
jgi:anthranilate/para-aminobenzoate synthase component I